LSNEEFLNEIGVGSDSKNTFVELFFWMDQSLIGENKKASDFVDIENLKATEYAGLVTSILMAGELVLFSFLQCLQSSDSLGDFKQIFTTKSLENLRTYKMLDAHTTKFQSIVMGTKIISTLTDFQYDYAKTCMAKNFRPISHLFGESEVVKKHHEIWTTHKRLNKLKKSGVI